MERGPLGYASQKYYLHYRHLILLNSSTNYSVKPSGIYGFPLSATVSSFYLKTCWLGQLTKLNCPYV